MIAVPNIPRALERAFQSADDAWDASKLHVSDLAVALDGEKCPRQLWLRVRGAEQRPLSLGQRLMFDHGHRIHQRMTQLLAKGLTGGWKLAAVELSVTDLLPDDMDGRLDTLLVGPNGERIVVDYKTVRGRAFQHLTEAKPAHVLQVRSYVRAMDADMGLVVYVDREGQNMVRQFPVTRDDKAVEDAIVKAQAIVAQKEPPPILPPQLEVKENKGPDSVKLKMPWMCDFCQFRDASCPGALPPEERTKEIVGYVKAGAFEPKPEHEKLVPKVTALLGASA